jgi:putative membrane-bound dehydrogenase-like protein
MTFRSFQAADPPSSISSIARRERPAHCAWVERATGPWVSATRRNRSRASERFAQRSRNLLVRCLPILLTATLSAAEFRFAAQTLTVPDGFVVEQAAGPPLVDRPITADFDETGALYVADSSGSNEKTDVQVKNPTHRILRLTDTDGDGRFDKSTVFADKMMFPEGTMWLKGSLYVSAPPSIWKLTDTNGDGVADQREEWYKGLTLTGCANDLHGPYRGRDGWIYWCKGAFAEQTHDIPGKAGWKTRASHIFRARPDGTGFEPVLTGGMDNPVDVVFTPSGERILSCTFLQHPGGGKRDGLIHAIYGGVYGKDHNVLDGHPRTGPLMPPLTHLGPAAACGLHYAETDGLGLRGSIFATLFNLHRVTRHELVPSGATYTTRDSDFLVSDSTDFHPTDVLEAPDGSLIVCDTGGWYKLCCPTSQLAKPDVLGAIYRVRRNTAAAKTAIWKPNPVWALAQSDTPQSREALRALLADGVADTRSAAAHVLGLWRDPQALEPLLARLKDESPHVRRAAAEAIGRLGNAKAVPMLLAALTGREDRVLEHSLTYALIEIGDAAAVRSFPSGEEPNPAQLRARLYALEQIPRGNLSDGEVLHALAASEASVREAALWVLARHAEWKGPAAAWLRERLEKHDLKDAELETLFATLAGGAARDLVPELPVDLACHVMQRAAPSDPPLAWIEFLTSRAAKQPAALEAAIALARTKGGAKRLGPVLRAAGGNSALADAARLAALAAVPDKLGELSAGEYEALRRMLLPAVPTMQRAEAAAVLARAKLSAEQRAQLAAVLHDCGALELSRLLPVLPPSEEPVARALLAAPALPGVQPDLLRTFVAALPASLQAEGGKLLAQAGGSPEEQRKRLDELTALMPKGDVRRGHQVFDSARASCRTCHALGYVGGHLGPDLSKIGAIRTDRDLLEAIAFPSASFVRSYEPVIVKTKDGTEQAGVLRGEGDEIQLATGPQTEVRLARAEVVSIQPSPVSLMPPGLDRILTPQELADVIAFLKSLR